MNLLIVQKENKTRIVNSQTAPASFDAAELKPNEIHLTKRLEELARSSVREKALKSLLKTKTEGSSSDRKQRARVRADPKRNTDWLIIDETSPTTVGSVVEWLKHRTSFDQHGLGSKPA